jgi:hypothetical protein
LHGARQFRTVGIGAQCITPSGVAF